MAETIASGWKAVNKLGKMIEILQNKNFALASTIIQAKINTLKEADQDEGDKVDGERQLSIGDVEASHSQDPAFEQFESCFAEFLAKLLLREDSPVKLALPVELVTPNLFRSLLKLCFSSTCYTQFLSTCARTWRRVQCSLNKGPVVDLAKWVVKIFVPEHDPASDVIPLQHPRLLTPFEMFTHYNQPAFHLAARILPSSTHSQRSTSIATTIRALPQESSLYKPLVVSKFCEPRNPYLVYIAYAKGLCDDELISITNNNSTFKQQARYLIKHCKPDLWAQVLVHDNVHHHQLIDQSFLQADLPIELIELLEKIIIEPSSLNDNKKLQNLLLLTAIHADKGKVVGYINKLQNYDASEIAKITTDHGLFKEALTIYKEYDQFRMPINVLVEHIVLLNCSVNFANKVNKPEVWSRLAKAQLNGLHIKDSIST
ncbi:hypothetical protein DXG03_006605 [Asterophora parasitica]|uniref:Uncharacterized protein n=1 Tax=Asterophora parasitica TaxID=117018 RepID=A0A9P7K9A2_9AGAR|nr:hypothetical protein DXG03_006605 [Asterophora parasitica]